MQVANLDIYFWLTFAILLTIRLHDKVEGHNPGLWLKEQRERRKEGSLTEKQIRLLDEIGMCWNNIREKISDRNWCNCYKLAEEYYKEHGDLHIPYGYEVKGVRLGIWISNQRQRQSKGYLPKERIRLLEAIGITWTSGIRGSHDWVWKEHYTELVSYYKIHGSLAIPKDYKDGGVDLRSWLKYQRAVQASGKLAEERQRLLHDLCPNWCEGYESLEAKWQKKYKYAVEYYQAHGNARIPSKYEVNGIKLGAWMYREREKLAAGCMDEAHRRQMALIGIS